MKARKDIDLRLVDSYLKKFPNTCNKISISITHYMKTGKDKNRFAFSKQLFKKNFQMIVTKFQ